MSDGNEEALPQPFAFFQFNTGWGVWEQVIEDARRRAAAWAAKIALPVTEANDDNVVPIRQKGATP